MALTSALHMCASACVKSTVSTKPSLQPQRASYPPGFPLKSTFPLDHSRAINIFFLGYKKIEEYFLPNSVCRTKQSDSFSLNHCLWFSTSKVFRLKLWIDAASILKLNFHQYKLFSHYFPTLWDLTLMIFLLRRLCTHFILL